MTRTKITLDPPQVAGWSWKQVVAGGLLAIAQAIYQVAQALEHRGHESRERT